MLLDYVRLAMALDDPATKQVERWLLSTANTPSRRLARKHLGRAMWSAQHHGASARHALSELADSPQSPLSPAQRETLNASLEQQTSWGFTPTLAAWQFALDQVTSWTPPPPPPDYSASPRYVVLITDGVPTVTRDGCTVQYPISQEEYDYLVDAVRTQGEAAGVKTFVVGVLGSEAPQGATYDPLYMLSQVALAGGTPQPEDCVSVSGTVSQPAVDPLLGVLTGDTNSLTSRGTYCHFDMTADTDFASGLLNALGTIVEQVESVVPMSCSHDVPPPPSGYFIDPEQITVTYTSGDGIETVLARSPDGSCAAGEWFVAAADEQGVPTRIELCPAICDSAGQDVGATVSIGFGCVTPM